MQRIFRRLLSSSATRTRGFARASGMTRASFTLKVKKSTLCAAHNGCTLSGPMAIPNATPAPLTQDAGLLDFLGAMTASPGSELEWIDLLSQLEYVGCRKIVKSIGFESVSLEVLRHVSEEASHAY